MDKENQKILEKEIDLIQSCLGRMAHNSFLIKGWTVLVVAAIFALLPEHLNARYLCLLVFMVIGCLWYLDAYYIKMERLYRWKYNWVITKRSETIDYAYNLAPVKPEMWLPDFKTQKDRKEPYVVRVMFTKTLVPFYGLILFITLLVFINTFANWLTISMV